MYTQEYSPHRRRAQKTQLIVYIKDIMEATAGNHATLTNHAGCGAEPNETKADQRCAKPFREIGVRWDGKIAGCCNDWRGVLLVGDLMKEKIDALWQSKVFDSMRKKLYAGERDFGACKGCDYVSYRNGLLPDHVGKETMDAPTKRDEKILLAACTHEPITTIIKRPWEK